MRHNVEENKRWYIDVLQKNSISILLLLISTFITILNTFAFIKLAPIIESQNSLSHRVEAIETTFNKHIDTSIPLVSDVVTMKQSIIDIKERIIRMENKIDMLVSK